jgi:hypothetical protein
MTLTGMKKHVGEAFEQLDELLVAPGAGVERTHFS